jgi:putative GTP pyrophosphokinase
VNQNKKSVASFQIDDTPSPQDSEKNFSYDFSLDFHDFLERLVDQPAEELTFTTSSVKKAGRKLRKREGDLKQATALIQTFRTAHEKPLNTIAYLIGRCCREQNIPVKPVKRLKRLETIIHKLQRKSLDGKKANQTCVTNMNDIGGCRAIFPDMASLNLIQKKLTETLEDEKRVKIRDIDDYISTPKENDCGYRSLHIIYQYEHSTGKKFKIEAQLRTRLQHIWATTVEIVDILERTQIKTHSHAPDEDKSNKQIKWEKLLSIMSQHIADVEGAIELTASAKLTNAQELKRIDGELCAVTRLRSFNMMTERIEADSKSNKGHVLLIVNESEMNIIVQKVFSNQAHATYVYNEMERVVDNIEGVNTLLVSTQNLGELSDAYPNYIGDCASFIEILCEAKNYE